MGRPAKYLEEFRREAVRLYRPSDRSRAEDAKSLGIAEGSLAALVKAAKRDEQMGALDPSERADPTRKSLTLASVYLGLLGSNGSATDWGECADSRRFRGRVLSRFVAAARCSA